MTEKYSSFPWRLILKTPRNIFQVILKVGDPSSTTVNNGGGVRILIPLDPSRRRLGEGIGMRTAEIKIWRGKTSHTTLRSRGRTWPGAFPPCKDATWIDYTNSSLEGVSFSRSHHRNNRVLFYGFFYKMKVVVGFWENLCALSEPVTLWTFPKYS